MTFNPTALVFWAFLAIVGGLLGGGTGALIGLAFGFGVSLLSEIFG